MTYKRLLNDIAEYVRNGERDARGFSLTHYPLYGDIPGREIQRLIDDNMAHANDLTKMEAVI